MVVIVFLKQNNESSHKKRTLELLFLMDNQFSLDELKQYNGKDGKPAYVAVDGIVYDVSASDKWKNGDHNGFEAGNDLTDEIKNVSPHGVKMLDRVPVVGKLAE